MPTGGEELLGDDERRLERLILGLRLADGVPIHRVDARRAAEYVTQGLAKRRGGRFALTDRGMFLANEIVLALAG